MRQRSNKRFKPRGPKPVPLETIFWDHVQKAGPDDCWVWEGAKTKFGYGDIKSHQKRYNAHRVAYELLNGPIPEGKHVCHACDNPSCCNPAHLWLGTAKDNARDMVQKGRHKSNPLKGADNGRAKITAAAVNAIRLDARPSEQIAREYGVKGSVVRAIRTGKAWAHIPMPANPPKIKVGRPKKAA